MKAALIPADSSEDTCMRVCIYVLTCSERECLCGNIHHARWETHTHTCSTVWPWGKRCVSNRDMSGTNHFWLKHFLHAVTPLMSGCVRFCPSLLRRGGRTIDCPTNRLTDQPTDGLNEAAPGASEGFPHVLICSFFFFYFPNVVSPSRFPTCRPTVLLPPSLRRHQTTMPPMMWWERFIQFTSYSVKNYYRCLLYFYS